MMFKEILILIFISCSFWVQSQSINQADVMQDRAIIVIHNITKSQLDGIKIEFEKHKEITAATYVYKDHNCLLVTMGDHRVLKYYADLLKIIQVATNITSQQMFLKTPMAYDEILAKDEEGTNVVVK